MSWLYVPGLGASNSESNSLSTISERAAASSLQWRGKPQPPQVWLRRWKRGGFITRLSGLTCSPSTLESGVASFISSLREIPAKTTALPESAPGPMGSGFSPPRSAALPPSAGLILSSAKTCRGTRTDSSEPSCQHWKGWATALRQEYSRRPRPATPCGASDCSSWPSARTSDTNGAGEHGDGGLDLRTAASQWMAPRTVIGAYTRDQGNPDAERLTLEGQAANWEAPENWPVPMAHEARLGYQQQPEDLVWTQQSLTTIAVDWVDHCLPPSSPAPAIAGGLMSSTDTPNSNQPSVKRKLNPIFVEALMRWPTGLSGFERQETAWTRWWQLQRSYLSALDWGSSDMVDQGSLF